MPCLFKWSLAVHAAGCSGMMAWSNTGWGGALGVLCSALSLRAELTLHRFLKASGLRCTNPTLCPAHKRQSCSSVLLPSPAVKCKHLFNANSWRVCCFQWWLFNIFERRTYSYELGNICLESHWCFNTFFLLQACPKQTGRFYGLNDLPIENSLIASPFVSQE